MRRLPRTALGFAACLSLACSSLIGLGDLEKADCVQGCDVANNGGSGGAPVSGQAPMGGATIAGAGATTGGSAGVATGGTTVTGGMSASGGTATSGGETGQGGDAPVVMGCPGGPEPPLEWTEHWSDHKEKLTRVHYDDCIAVYFDADVAPATQPWLVKFLHDAWTYSLDTYGKVGSERIYVVVHQGKFQGGHSATEIEASHDGHATIDMGANTWVEGQWDLPAHLLGFLVDTQGAHTKYGAPKSEHYGNEGFPLIYKYDLYLALGYSGYASSELQKYLTYANGNPADDTFWLRDWFLPVWRDHGNAQLFARYMDLLEHYYPAGADHWMPTMTYGQYFHFMSGAAGVDLVPTAKTAFEWSPELDDELAAAKLAFPNITY